MLRFLNRLVTGVLLVIGPTARAATYEVGPDKPYTSIGAVPWETIQAGDLVLIHWRTNAYREKWVICRQGTNNAPITVRGVIGPGGELPVIDGENATTRTNLNYWNEARGVIKIGGANRPHDLMPRWITIENLDIRNARPGFDYIGFARGTNEYTETAAALYIEKGENITIRNCILRDSANGLFVASSDSHTSKQILVEKCYIVDNGLEGDLFRHNVYTAAAGITFQFNRFGPLRTNCPGNNIKDRSAGLVVRYNWIEGGNRQLDLVDAEDSYLLRGDPRYRQTYVYGNVLIETTEDSNRQITHYGGDSGVSSYYRKGTLYFYNNTIISRRNDGLMLFHLSSSEEKCDFRNNIVYVTAPGNTISLLEGGKGVLTLSHNWFKSGCTTCFNAPTAAVKNDGTSISGTTPGFLDEYVEDGLMLAPSSLCINAGTNLHDIAAASNAVTFQYVSHQEQEVRPQIAPMDIGAFESTYQQIAPAFSKQSSQVTVMEGRAAAFSVTVTGTQPIDLQWFHEGVAIAGQTNLILHLYPVGTTNEGNYMVRATNIAGFADSVPALLTVTNDPTPPSVRVTAPVGNVSYTEQVTNYIFLAMGTAADNARVERVRVRINTNDWQDATLNTNGTSVSWQCPISVLAGTNTFMAKSVDFHGRESTTTTIKFFHNAWSTLTLITNGYGFLTPTTNALGVPTNGASLLVGRSYKLSALAATNWVLTNWTDGSGSQLATNVSPFTFIMRSNLVLQANFITNPLARFGGSYNGLILHDDGVSLERNGFITVKVTAKFGYSGKLFIDGDVITFSGKLRLVGSTDKVILRTKQQKSSLLLSFSLDFANASDTLNGSLSEGGTWSSTISADRSVWATNNLATAFTNNFTMLLPLVTNCSTNLGYGYGAGSVSPLGKAVFSGAVADGRAIAQNIPISKYGEWPLFVPLYHIKKIVTNGLTLRTNVEAQGMLIGWANFTNRFPFGTVAWLKRPETESDCGFTNGMELLASTYQKPVRQRMLTLTNGVLICSGGNPLVAVSRNFTLSTNNGVAFSPPDPRWTLTPAVQNGICKGTFVHPLDTNVATKFSGAILQNQNFGGGFFRTTNLAGAIVIEPR
jgi:hypothetical protein